MEESQTDNEQIGAEAADVTSHPQDAKASAAFANNRLLAIIVAAGLLGFGIYLATFAFDNDLWWLLATGRSIVEQGIPTTNPFTMHEGLNTVFQQWLHAVIIYLVYSLGGLTGIEVLVFLQIAALIGSLYALACERASRCRGRLSKGAETRLLLIALVLGSVQAYLSCRPYPWTMIAFTCVLLVLERYRRLRNPKILVWLPVICLVHVNLHAAMAPFDLFIIALYLIPCGCLDWRCQRARRKELPFALRLGAYRRLPLLVAFIVCGVAMFVNPYGINGAFYLLESYGSADYGSFINEMKPTGMLTVDAGFMVTSIMAACACVGAMGRKRIDFPPIVLFLVCVPLTLMHQRNICLAPLFAFPLMATVLGQVSLMPPMRMRLSRFLSSRKVALAAGIVATTCIVVGCCTALQAGSLEEQDHDGYGHPVKAADYLDEYCLENGIDKGGLRVFNGFNAGGYLEWRGYKVFIDARPELWEPAITGNEKHFYQEYVDLVNGDYSSAGSLLDEYTFDFVISTTSAKFTSALSDAGYKVVVFGGGYRLWQRE